MYSLRAEPVAPHLHGPSHPPQRSGPLSTYLAHARGSRSLGSLSLRPALPRSLPEAGDPAGRLLSSAPQNQPDTQLLPDLPSEGKGHPPRGSHPPWGSHPPDADPPQKLRDTRPSTWSAVRAAEHRRAGHRHGLADVRRVPAREVVPDASASCRGTEGGRGTQV